MRISILFTKLMNIKRPSILFIIVCVVISVCNGQNKTREIIIKHPDSTIIFHVVNEKADLDLDLNKVYYWYYGNTISKNLGAVSGYILHGKYEVLNSNNKLISQGGFCYGLKDGIWQKFYPPGGLKSRLTWRKGILYGTASFYGPTGNPIKKLNYKKGDLHGKQYYYSGKNELEIKEYWFGRLEVKNEKKKKPEKKKRENRKKEKNKRKPKEDKTQSGDFLKNLLRKFNSKKKEKNTEE